jgi:hypothetical protein
MKKKYLSFLSLLFVFSVSYCQDPLEAIRQAILGFPINKTIPKITHSYFRSNPFNQEFSSFVTHLLNDPILTDKVFEKRTDTSLFYFEGTYKSFNPFFFKPTRVEVTLSQTPVKLDSLRSDTIYTYQLIAYNNSTPENLIDLKKEFEKINRHYKNAFQKTDFVENPWETEYTGGLYIFYDKYHVVSPFLLSWRGPDKNKEICLMLTIRMDVEENEAVLPIPFYTSQ